VARRRSYFSSSAAESSVEDSAVAAAVTAGNAIIVAAFNVLHNVEIYQKLAAELRTRFPDPDSEWPFVELEKFANIISQPARCTDWRLAEQLI